jgi:hypothetical protein
VAEAEAGVAEAEAEAAEEAEVAEAAEEVAAAGVAVAVAWSAEADPKLGAAPEVGESTKAEGQAEAAAPAARSPAGWASGDRWSRALCLPTRRDSSTEP